MTPWKNDPITLYHGTDDLAAKAITTAQPPFSHGIDINRCSRLTDFGQGFYTTTNLHQAKNWANVRYRLSIQKPGQPTPARAVVLKFDVDRDDLGSLHSMAFVVEPTQGGGDFWDFVRNCRHGRPHRPQARTFYDAVLGLVSLWPQTLTIKDCDQVSFHTSHALSVLPNASIAHRGKPTF